MALDLNGKDVSVGQVQISVWDVTNNALRVTAIGGTAGDASAANQLTQIGLAEDTNDLIDDSNTLLTTSNTLLTAISNHTLINPVTQVVGASVYKDYSVTPVTSAAYVQLTASLSSAATEIEVFSGTGSALYLAIGAAASEINQVILVPGGNGRIPVAIPAASRVSVKAVDTSATTGLLIVNYYG